MSRKRVDEMGKRYGSWTIVGVKEHRYTSLGREGGWFNWIAKCDCGYQGEVQISALRAGKSKSCYRCGWKKNAQRAADAKEARYQKLARFAP